MITLTTYSALARVLTSEDPLIVQFERFFEIVRAELPELDLRITIWEGSQTHAWSTYVERSWDQLRTNQIARRRQPLLLQGRRSLALPANDLLVQNDRLSPSSAEDGGSYLGMPVLWEGRLWAVLEVRRQGTFSGAEHSLLTSLLPLLAVAISEEQWGRLTPNFDPDMLTQRALTHLAQELIEPLDLSTLVQTLLRESMQAVSATAGAVNLIDKTHQEYSLVLSEGYAVDQRLSESRQTWPLSVGVVGRAARTGKASLLTDTSHTQDWATDAADVRAELIIPVQAQNGVLAVLVLATNKEPIFSTQDLHTAQSIAQLAARPLQRALEYRELVETRNQLQQTLSSLPLGFALTDLEGRVLRTNEAWYKLWHISEAHDDQPQYLPWDLLPALLKRLSHPLELTDFFAETQKARQEPHELTLSLLEPVQDVRIRSTPVVNAHGISTGRVVMIEDITREREIDQMKNEFVSVVSHELRTPLTSILGYTELLLARDFPAPERQEFMQTVYDQAEQLSKMVDDLLSLSRLDAGQIQLNRWMVSLHQVIREITRQLNETLSEKHRLLIDIPQGIPPIYADKDKIRQVLTNLLSNAVKYSPQGGQVALIVRELRKAPPNAPALPKERAVLLAVHDQGIGIKAEDIPHVFNRFFRVDNSITRKIGGTGLGLSITKALVELHGGRIWVTSEPGKGTTFWLTLPIATELARRS